MSDRLELLELGSPPLQFLFLRFSQFALIHSIRRHIREFQIFQIYCILVPLSFSCEHRSVVISIRSRDIIFWFLIGQQFLE